MSVTMALFTRDLRVCDNPVLAAAARGASRTVAAFVLDDSILSSSFSTPNKAAFLVAALTELDEQLRRLGAQLVVRHGDVVDEVARLVDECSITDVHIAADVSAYSAHRENELRARLADRHCRLHSHEASITVFPSARLTPRSDAEHFSVFTPYYRHWAHTPVRAVVPTPATLRTPAVRSEALPSAAQLCRGTSSPQLRVGGEIAGRALLAEWLSGPVDDYERSHNDLAADATSHLSPYLHFGCVSPVEVVRRTGTATQGRQAFTRQLAWRDFHHQLLAARPDATQHDYRGRQVDRQHDAALLAAWRGARTGYPIVDAGMRQLAAQGWMHNRARLITASFLTKTLRLDWRLGAAHFMGLLVDADVANNQLNWQWVAGTGTDTRPHRVLNPVRQAQRYDPDGGYVRRWLPELAALPAAHIHAPWEQGSPPTSGYPAPVVDHLAAARVFRAARAGK